MKKSREKINISPASMKGSNSRSHDAQSDALPPMLELRVVKCTIFTQTQVGTCTKRIKCRKGNRQIAALNPSYSAKETGIGPK